MQFTNSVDGVKRCDIRITVRMDRDDLINALAASTAGESLGELPEKIGARSLLKRVRAAVARFGESTTYWAEDREDSDEILAWVTENVDRILKMERS